MHDVPDCVTVAVDGMPGVPDLCLACLASLRIGLYGGHGLSKYVRMWWVVPGNIAFGATLFTFSVAYVIVFLFRFPPNTADIHT